MGFAPLTRWRLYYSHRNGGEKRTSIRGAIASHCCKYASHANTYFANRHTNPSFTNGDIRASHGNPNQNTGDNSDERAHYCHRHTHSYTGDAHSYQCARYCHHHAHSNTGDAHSYQCAGYCHRHAHSYTCDTHNNLDTIAITDEKAIKE